MILSPCFDNWIYWISKEYWIYWIIIPYYGDISKEYWMILSPCFAAKKRAPNNW